jgi:hypothetical protein
MRRMRLPGRLTPALLCLVIAAGCTESDRRPSASPASSPSPSASSTPLVTATAVPTATAAPTPVPLSLEPPQEQSDGTIEFRFSPNLPADAQGELLVIVTNTGEKPIEEIALRWPTALNEILYLAPFAPGPDRLVNPLVVPWTRWVEGPGTRGEPAGTTTLGYGPIDPGMQLQIPLVAQWREPQEVEFDVQFLDRERLLLLSDGQPAHVRVDIAPT